MLVFGIACIKEISHLELQAAVTDIQVISQGFLSCGGDGSVKLVQLKEHSHGT